MQYEVKTIKKIGVGGYENEMNSVIKSMTVDGWNVQHDFSTEGISAWKHGREHPETALRNAERIFRLGWKEKILYTAICGPYISRIYHCAGKQ